MSLSPRRRCPCSRREQRRRSQGMKTLGPRAMPRETGKFQGCDVGADGSEPAGFQAWVATHLQARWGLRLTSGTLIGFGTPGYWSGERDRSLSRYAREQSRVWQTVLRSAVGRHVLSRRCPNTQNPG